MGWLTEDLKLGPNLLIVFWEEKIPNVSDDHADLKDDDGKFVFWQVKDGFLQLSINCNWRFINLKKAFHKVTGTKTRSMFIYSNVGSSTIVGNKVRDLLREIPYKRTGDGIVYFEPRHVQDIPLRNEVIDILETNVTETRGELQKFSPGETILVLHF